MPAKFCESCSQKFTLWRKRVQCLECNLCYCDICMPNAARESKPCIRCQVLSARPLTKDSLMQFRIRDLKSFLSMQHIPVRLCKVLHSTQPMFGCNSNIHCDGIRVRGWDDYEDLGIRVQPSSSSILESSPPYSTSTNSTASSCSQSIPISVPQQNSTAQSTTLSCIPSLSDVKSVEHLEHLDVHTCRALLSKYRVSYQGCCEKEELLVKLRSLWIAKTIKKEDVADEDLCCICMQAGTDCVLLECGHMCCCTDCGKQMHECPICRQYVVRVVHVFRA